MVEAPATWRVIGLAGVIARENGQLLITPVDSLGPLFRCYCERSCYGMEKDNVFRRQRNVDVSEQARLQKRENKRRVTAVTTRDKRYITRYRVVGACLPRHLALILLRVSGQDQAF